MPMSNFHPERFHALFALDDLVYSRSYSVYQRHQCDIIRHFLMISFAECRHFLQQYVILKRSPVYFSYLMLISGVEKMCEQEIFYRYQWITLSGFRTTGPRKFLYLGCVAERKLFFSIAGEYCNLISVLISTFWQIYGISLSAELEFHCTCSMYCSNVDRFHLVNNK